MSRKYPLLDDKSWLEKKYIEERLSSRAISELIGCCTTSVENGLKRFKIPVRNGVESHIRFSQLLDKEWLEMEYLEKRLSSTEIGKMIGCDSSSVTCALVRLGIPRRNHLEARRRSVREGDKALLESLYIDKGLNAYEIGERFGCNKTTIYNALKGFGIPRRRPIGTYIKEVGDKDVELLESLYLEGKKNCREIGEGLGCSSSWVYKVLKAHGVPIRPLTEAKSHESSYLELNDKEWLYNKYHINRLSGKEIGDILGCDCSTVLKRLAKHGILRRTASELIRESRKKSRHLKCRTTIEVKLESIFKKHCDSIEYTGDGSFWITTSNESVNPDFIIKDKKIAIEANGDYWHSPLLNHNIRKGCIVNYRGKQLKRKGWKLIVFWETDINRDDAEQYVLHVLRREGIV